MAAAWAGRGWPSAWAAGQPKGYRLVAAADRGRILRLAGQWLGAEPQTVTMFRSPRSPGSLHDFFSEADYFWPNPQNPAGPYKEIDGRSNPDNFQEHRRAMIRLSLAAPALAAAHRLTGQRKYAEAAAAHLRAWFCTPETRMNPNLQFAQGVRNGGPTGRSYGIIDTLHLVEVARAAPFVRAVMGPAEYAGVQGWFREYVSWMRTSVPGQKERDATNNHAIAWALQVAQFSRTAGEDATVDAMREMTLRLLAQMAPDGSFPRELARTKPYGYSIFAFDCLAALAWTVSPADGDGAVLRAVLPTEGDGGRSVCKGAEFLFPYLADKGRWPYAHDVQHWESWPVRSPGLLFCGLACEKPEYVALWRKLEPDPSDPEVIRNFPIRQPLLWV